MQQTTIPFVSYLAEKTEDRGILCRCDAFTSEQIEFISAYEILESRKLRNDSSFYDQYIAICAEHGIDQEKRFIQSNRHTKIRGILLISSR